MKKSLPIILGIIISFSVPTFSQIASRTYLTGSQDDISINPVFSPDGNYLAFTKAGYHGIYIYDLISKSHFQLTDEPAAGFAFKWSSDSKYILTRVARYSDLRRYNSVKIFDIQAGTASQITEEFLSMPFLPEWAPGNHRVVIPIKERVELIESGISQSYNANEQPYAVYSLNDRIAVIDFSDQSERIMQPLPGKQYLNVTISPDRSKIVFEVYGGNMYVMNIDGTGLIDLGIGYNPKWTFDSRQIVFMITEDDGHKFTSSDIYLINADGSNKRNITNTKDIIELNPSISPDGKKLAYEDYSEGAIYLMNLD